MNLAPLLSSNCGLDKQTHGKIGRSKIQLESRVSGMKSVIARAQLHIGFECQTDFLFAVILWMCYRLRALFFGPTLILYKKKISYLI